MSDIESDFLDAIGREFENKANFADYIHDGYIEGNLSGGFNVIGAVNNLSDEQETFRQNLSRHFEIIDSSGDLSLIHTKVDDENVFSYVYFDEHVPIFLTKANKTDQIPPTIWNFLQETQDIGRLMLSKREIDETRKEIVSNHENVMIPFFSARRTAESPIEARRRPKTERSIQYRGDDGLETYREMRYNYGVLPSIMTFELPNKFKFKIKNDGTFVHTNGGFKTLWKYLETEIDRVKEMMQYANTGAYGKADSDFFGEENFSVSTPWAVEVDDGIEADSIKTLPNQLNESFWEFSVSEYSSRPKYNAFEAEVIDKTTHERTTLKTKGSDVRIFPREFTDIDQSLRIYNFISDHFDSNCTPKKVA